MNIAIAFGIIMTLVGVTGVWASKIKYPTAPGFFPNGQVLSYTRVSYFVALIGVFLIFWGVFSKLSNFTLRVCLKIALTIIVLWIGYQFYVTNIWDWQRFLKF